MKRSIPVVLAMVLLLAALAGCGDNPKPIEPTTSATTIPVPTPAAQASDDTPEGRAAFAAYFVDLVNYTARTGDTAPMLAQAADCKSCVALADSTISVRVGNQRPPTDMWLIESVEVHPSSDRVIVHLAENPEYDIQPRQWGIQVTPSTPFRVIEVVRIDP